MKLKVEYYPIESIKPYENNAKIHTEEQIEQIVKSIKDFGMNDPIAIWSEDNIIIEGHGRLMACKKLGMTEVPIIRLDDLTDEQRRAYTLIHNQTTMNTGFDIDILNEELGNLDIDMSEFGFENITEDDIEIEEDGFNFEEELPPEAKSKKGEIYQLGNHRLMCGDSTKPEDVEKLMNGNLADLVVTDPPYNVDYTGKTKEQLKIKNDSMEDEAFKEFLIKAFRNMNEALKEGGAFYVWYASREHINFESALNENDLYVRQQLIWVKNVMVLGRQDYQWKHEPCLYGWKDGKGHYFIDEYNHTTVYEDKIDFDKLKKEDLIHLLKDIYEDGISTTVIHENKPIRSDLHPTMKPINLMARLIKNSSQKEEIVLDLFGGSGSTLITCEQLNRKCFMMEFDPIYVDTIIKRWEDYTGQKVVKLNG